MGGEGMETLLLCPGLCFSKCATSFSSLMMQLAVSSEHDPGCPSSLDKKRLRRWAPGRSEWLSLCHRALGVSQIYRICKATR